MAGYILSDRRTRTSDDNFENQLFANVNLDLSESRLRRNWNWDKIRTWAAKNENGIIFTNETESEKSGERHMSGFNSRELSLKITISEFGKAQSYLNYNLN